MAQKLIFLSFLFLSLSLCAMDNNNNNDSLEIVIVGNNGHNATMPAGNIGNIGTLTEIEMTTFDVITPKDIIPFMPRRSIHLCSRDKKEHIQNVLDKWQSRKPHRYKELYKELAAIKKKNQEILDEAVKDELSDQKKNKDIQVESEQLRPIVTYFVNKVFQEDTDLADARFNRQLIKPYAIAVIVFVGTHVFNAVIAYIGTLY